MMLISLLQTKYLCPPKLLCSNPNSQNNGISKWGLWMIIGVTLSQEGGGFPDRISVLMRRGSHRSSPPFSLTACTKKGLMRTQGEKCSRNQKEGPHPTLTLPTSWTSHLQNCNKCLFCKPFSISYLVIAVQAGEDIPSPSHRPPNKNY